ncbi:MAG TPA: hypothetical protein VK928_09715 [Longimicrobiales bacterium]|nr:hypothetical protein [Longimicrobiales bacterium]
MSGAAPHPEAGGGAASTLEQVCRAPAPDDTEIFPPNAWYGAARAVRAYSGWPAGRPLPLVLPHGVVLGAGAAWDYELRARLPAVYSFPAFRDDAYAAGRPRVVPGCSPWLYHLATAHRAPQERDTVLLMPAHSSHHVTADFDEERFLDDVRTRFDGRRITCCMYWRDVEIGRHLLYRRNGIEVVSAGHMLDPLFFRRLGEFFARAEVLVTNELGSHIFYAAAAGTPVRLMTGHASRWLGAAEIVARDVSTAGRHERNEIAACFDVDTPDLAQQQQMAHAMLGGERMQEPAALRQLLEALWRTRGFRTTVVLPWRLRRSLRRLRRLRP